MNQDGALVTSPLSRDRSLVCGSSLPLAGRRASSGYYVAAGNAPWAALSHSSPDTPVLEGPSPLHQRDQIPALSHQTPLAVRHILDTFTYLSASHAFGLWMGILVFTHMFYYS